MTFVDLFLSHADSGEASLPRAAKLLLGLVGAMKGSFEAFGFDPNQYLEEAISPEPIEIVPAQVLPQESTIDDLLAASEALRAASSEMVDVEHRLSREEAQVRVNSGRFFTQVSELPAYVPMSTSDDDEDFI